MKMKAIPALLLAAAFSVQAQERPPCGGFNDYDVRKVSFTDAPIAEAITKITSGMPWQVEVTGGEGVKISASNVSGPLGGVLDKLAEQAKFKYRADRCVLLVDVAVQPKLQVWRISSGDKISEVIRKWAQVSGWQLTWEVPEMVAEAEVSLTGAFEDAVTELINALNRNGAGMRPVFYEGNRMLRVTERN